MRTITPLRKAALIVAAVLLGTALISIIPGAGAAEPGQALAPNCQVNVALGAAAGLPVAAIEAMLARGGAVTIEHAGDWVYQLTVRRWTLHEDDERWPDLRDFEVECR